MKTTLELEERALFLLGIFAFGLLHFEWWWYVILLLPPDIGMFGYLDGNKTGALLYNLFHHKGVAVVIFFIGYSFSLETLQLAGIIIFSHSSVDRMADYELKYKKDFKFTHLGEIGGNGQQLKAQL